MTYFIETKKDVNPHDKTTDEKKDAQCGNSSGETLFGSCPWIKKCNGQTLLLLFRLGQTVLFADIWFNSSAGENKGSERCA